jgi:hypothetical protein
MGQELECKARIQRRTRMRGKAQLETDFILFRGPERLKITFSELTGVTADGGILKLEFSGGPLELELGDAAEKWARKILNPPSVLDKLGVKPGLTVRLIGDFDAFEPGFAKQIAAQQAKIATTGKCNLLFLAAAKSADLARIAKLKANLETGGALWLVYPKGVSHIKEIEVIQAGRAAGMKDVKVARFSSTHTALKFV